MRHAKLRNLGQLLVGDNPSKKEGVEAQSVYLLDLQLSHSERECWHGDSKCP